jgi:hypothetical protein
MSRVDSFQGFRGYREFRDFRVIRDIRVRDFRTQYMTLFLFSLDRRS